jgi:hypothetical protein
MVDLFFCVLIIVTIIIIAITYLKSNKQDDGLLIANYMKKFEYTLKSKKISIAGNLTVESLLLSDSGMGRNRGRKVFDCTFTDRLENLKSCHVTLSYNGEVQIKDIKMLERGKSAYHEMNKDDPFNQ